MHDARSSKHELLSAIAVAALLMAPSAAQVKRLRPPDVRFVPTPQNVVEAMLDLAQVTPADVVYDLGSGDGRIPITAAQKYGARGVGVEIEPRLIAEANANAAGAHVADRVWFLNQDLFETDISPATVVTMFLLPRLNQQLMPTLQRTLRPGTRIVSHQFDMGPAWPPERSQDVNGLMVYLWTIR
jgi:cyclopropane fatty-acyl-phospholipid synthase-like methyltransferase